MTKTFTSVESHRFVNTGVPVMMKLGATEDISFIDNFNAMRIHSPTSLHRWAAPGKSMKYFIGIVFEAAIEVISDP